MFISFSMRLNFFSGMEDKYLTGESQITKSQITKSPSNPYTLPYPKPKILNTVIWDFFPTLWLDWWFHRIGTRSMYFFQNSSTEVKRRVSNEEQREKEIQSRFWKQTEKRSSTKRSKLQRIRERRGGKSCPIWVFSYAKTQEKIQTFFLPIVVWY